MALHDKLDAMRSTELKVFVEEQQQIDLLTRLLVNESS
jgi:hypothetical protein